MDIFFWKVVEKKLTPGRYPVQKIWRPKKRRQFLDLHFLRRNEGRIFRSYLLCTDRILRLDNIGQFGDNLTGQHPRAHYSWFPRDLQMS